jgi:hypothetical protein
MSQESPPPLPTREDIALANKARSLYSACQRDTASPAKDFPRIDEIIATIEKKNLLPAEQTKQLARLYQEGIKERVNNTTTEATPTPRTRNNWLGRVGAAAAATVMAVAAGIGVGYNLSPKTTSFCNTTKAEQASIINHVKLGGAKAGYKDVAAIYTATSGRDVFDAAYNRTLEKHGKQQASDMVVQALQNQWNNCGRG